MNSNLDLYNKVRTVPQEAQKEIQAGRLKGKTDINPMWRIKTLTEQFGVCGFGWKTEIVREWLEAGGCLSGEGEHAGRLKAELSTPLYWYDAAGKIVLEPKDKIKERLGASPDIADALALTFAAPVALPDTQWEQANAMGRDGHGLLYGWRDSDAF